MTRAITHHQANGGDVAMLTLTMRHNAAQNLADLWAALTDAWRSTTHGKTWTDDRREFGVIGYCRAVEVTHGRHGWHVHVHAVIFLREQLAPELLRALGVRMFARWQMRLRKIGLSAPMRDRGGLDIRQAYGKADDLGGYISKYGTEVDSALRDRARSLALEATAGDLKTARKGNRTPWQILTDAMAGDRDSLVLWREWERASRGRRRWTWSHAAADNDAWAAVLAARGADLTDEEVAAEEAGGDFIAAFSNDQWRVLRANAGLPAAVLAAAERAGFAGICAAVAPYGLIPAKHPPGRSDQAA